MQKKTSKTPSGILWAFSVTGLLLLTLIVRVGWLHIFPSQAVEPVDAEGYVLLARNLLTGHGFAIAWEAPFCPNTVRTPLYPLFLAMSFLLLGPTPQHAVVLQCLLEVITCAVVIRFGRDLGQWVGGKPRSELITGALAGFLYAINGTTQRYTGFLFSETLLLPLMTTAILLSCRFLRNPKRWMAFAAGVFWALAVLTKPNIQYLAIGTGAVCALSVVNHTHINRPGRYTFIWFWVALTLVLFPWLARNKQATARWMVSSAFEENLARVAAVATQAQMMGVHSEPWTETWEYIYASQKTRLGLQEGWIFSSIPRFSCSQLAYQQTQIAQTARQFVLQHLVIYGKAHLSGVTRSLLDPGHRLWYPILTGKPWTSTGVVPDIGERVRWSLERKAVGDAIQAFVSQRITQIPPIAGALWWGLWLGRLAVCVVTLRGYWYLRRSPWALSILLGSLLYMLILPGPIAHDRFYVPAVPTVTALSALGTYTLTSHRHQV